MLAQTLQNRLNSIVILLLSGLMILVVALAISSLRWEYEHDTPLLNYAGLLIVKFLMIPYRDFFETSFPGVFLFHAGMIYFFGQGNLAFSLVDLVFIGSVLLVSWGFLIRIDKAVAVAFVPLYGLTYLAGGQSAILQRDGLVVLPIAATLALVASRRPSCASIRQVFCGFLFGVVATIKPQLTLGAPVVILLDALLETAARRHESGTIRISQYMWLGIAWLSGFLVPIAASLVWLAANDALWPFFFMVTQYLPLHIKQNGGHVFLPPAEHFWYVVRNTLFAAGLCDFFPFVGLAIFAAWTILCRNREKSIMSMAVIVLLIIYFLCPVLAGQFWYYHYMPFMYFMCLVLSFLILPIRRAIAHPRLAVMACLALVFVSAGIIKKEVRLSEFERHEAKNGFVARVVTALSATLKPGDTVQPIDWTDGVIHAMLRLQLPIATPFLYDYHFYHDVDSPVIQSLRERFLQAMMTNRPTLLVEATQRPRVSGVGTASSFPAFDRLVSEKYQVVYEEPDFRILRRIDAKS